MQFTQFSKISTRQEIDAANAVIKGVSVITMGEASGHGLMIDETTLDQVISLASKFTGGLKVRFNHPSREGAPIQSNAGKIKSFRKDGNCARGDLHLLKTDLNTPKILEMASEMPEDFGLSIVFSGKNEEKDGQNFARCSDIYACDLVDDPAANPTGLFSKPTENKSMFDKIKTMLGFPVTATEDEIVTALSKKEQETKAALEKTSFSAAIAEALKPVTDEIIALKADKGQQIALAKKTEIDALIVEASKEGKVLPLEVGDVYEVKDGITTIKMEPSMLRKMIEKLPKAQVQLQRRQVTTPKGQDGKTFARGSQEWQDFWANKRAEGADELTRQFSSIGN